MVELLKGREKEGDAYDKAKAALKTSASEALQGLHYPLTVTFTATATIDGEQVELGSVIAKPTVFSTNNRVVYYAAGPIEICGEKAQAAINVYLDKFMPGKPLGKKPAKAAKAGHETESESRVNMDRSERTR